ncbi:MAG: hypothetical protein ACRDQA_12825 [Nocardioidaceae bacterium]
MNTTHNIGAERQPGSDYLAIDRWLCEDTTCWLAQIEDWLMCSEPCLAAELTEFCQESAPGGLCDLAAGEMVGDIGDIGAIAAILTRLLNTTDITSGEYQPGSDHVAIDRWLLEYATAWMAQIADWLRSHGPCLAAELAEFSFSGTTDYGGQVDLAAAAATGDIGAIAASLKRVLNTSTNTEGDLA